MRVLVIMAVCAAIGGCAASRQEVATRLGDQFIGQNTDVLVAKFGPPASTYTMNSGDTSFIWQLAHQTNHDGDRGSSIVSSKYCKLSVVADKSGVVKQLDTEDANAGGGIAGAVGLLGSICANRLGIEKRT